MSELENMRIPVNFDYNKLSALSNEALQKLKKIRPTTLGQASRVSGVNPSDVQILMVYMGR
jgi:tRNA uridine 5-carboxymethylaminomethyl modification enzyme